MATTNLTQSMAKLLRLGIINLDTLPHAHKIVKKRLKTSTKKKQTHVPVLSTNGDLIF